VAYVRTVKTSSGATAVQIVHSSRKGSRSIEHLGSAHSLEEVEALKAVAAQRLVEGQAELDLGLEVAAAAASGGPLEITGTRMGHLVDALSRAYDALGFAEAAKGDDVFRQLVLARIIEPTSKEDSIRVLEEIGIAAPTSYRTIKRRLAVYAQRSWREGLATACAARASLGPASLMLYDVTTLYFETHEGDGFREPGFSKERRLEPQTTVGLLTDAAGFPLMIEAFEGNKAETKTMLSTITSFMAAHQLADVAIVADAGMVSEANREAIEDAGLSYITNMTDPTPEFVINAYHQLWHVEKSFRMSKHDLRARPIYHHKRDSIDVHLNIVFAALAVTRLIEDRTGWSIKRFVRTTRRYRTVAIRVGQHAITAEDPVPPDLRDALAQIN